MEPLGATGVGVLGRAHFSGESAKDTMEAWRRFVASHISSLEVAYEDDWVPPEAWSLRTKGFQITDIKAGGEGNIVRNSTDVRRGHSNSMACLFSVSGQHIVTQDNRELACNPEQFLLIDLAKPYEHHRTGVSHTIYFVMPKSFLAERVGHMSEALQQIHDCAAGLAGAALSLARGMLVDAHLLTPLAFETICQSLGEIVALALMGDKNGEQNMSTRRNAMFLQVRRYIRNNLGSQHLTAIRIASECGLSERYLHELFHATGQTVSQFLWKERLQRSRAMLNDPSRRHRSITEIAFGCGFSDSGHFSNSFRKAFGISPRDFRKQSLFSARLS